MTRPRVTRLGHLGILVKHQESNLVNSWYLVLVKNQDLVALSQNQMVDMIKNNMFHIFSIKNYENKT